MRSSWRSAIRTSAFVRKELVETLRQPRMILALVLAPFLILLVFGTGLKDHDPLIATVVVVPGDTGLAAEVERFATEPSWRLQVRAIVEDTGEALDQLERGEVDLVVVFPEDAAATVRSNRRATVDLYHNLVDPIESRALGLATRVAVDRLNQLILNSLVAQAQARSANADERLERAHERLELLRRAAAAGDETSAQAELALLHAELLALSLQLPAARVLESPQLRGEANAEPTVGATLTDLAQALEELSGGARAEREAFDQIARDLDRLGTAITEFQSLSPATLVNPFKGSLRRLGTTQVGLTDFFAPGVIVLLLQHLLVALVGLSVVHDEQLGTTELLRVAPVTIGEVLLGKTLSYLLLSTIVAALLVTLVVAGLGVPLAGSVPVLAAGLAAVLLASVGMGFVIALLARNDGQVVQYAMLVLLASIFLTGFIISLERVVPAVQVVAWLLPATYGMALLRGVMLRGAPLQPLLLLGLVGIAAILLAVSWVLLRRRFEPGAGANQRP